MMFALVICDQVDCPELESQILSQALPLVNSVQFDTAVADVSPPT